VRRTPVAIVPRDQLDAWMDLTAVIDRPEPGGTAEEVLGVLRKRGASFVQEIVRGVPLPLASVEEGLRALVAQGRATCDSFSGLRWLLLPSWRRRSAGISHGRWSELAASAPALLDTTARAEFVARRLLRRTGVVFRRTLARERIPVAWRDIARACRTLEARGEIRARASGRSARGR
jgi:ATP-dependent Lhr-like helicase